METCKPCTHGSYLLSLCKSVSLSILNGRCIGDSLGSFTRFSTCNKKYNENPSVIDYGLTSFPFLESIRYFRVADLTTLSDHCCITANITINFTIAAQVDNIQGQSCPERFLWKSPYKEKFYDQVNSRETKTISEELSKVDFDNNQYGIDNAVTSLPTSLIQVAKKPLPVLKFRKHKKSNSVKKKMA